MGCTDSKPAVITQPTPAPLTTPSVGNGPMTEEGLKKMLMDKQIELSARAKPLLESRNEDFQEQPDEAEMESVSKSISSQLNSPDGKQLTKDQQLYKIAKTESANAWMVMNDLPISEDDVAYLKAFKTVVLDHIPKLTDGGNTYEAGQELSNRDDTPATSCAGSVCGDEATAAGSVVAEEEEEEEDAIISAPRRNSKLIDVRETVIAKFGALENIPNAAASEVSLHSSPVRERLRRDSNAPEMITIKRQNSVERFLKLDTLQVINENAILQNNTLDRIKIDKNITSPGGRTRLGSGKGGGLYGSPKKKKKTIPDWQIPKGPMSLKTATSIYETYKQGGACTKETVHKVLRTAYRTMKKQPNVMHVSLESDERLNVVGDLHGQLLDLVHILEESGIPSDKNR